MSTEKVTKDAIFPELYSLKRVQVGKANPEDPEDFDVSVEFRTVKPKLARKWFRKLSLIMAGNLELAEEHYKTLDKEPPKDAEGNLDTTQFPLFEATEDAFSELAAEMLPQCLTKIIGIPIGDRRSEDMDLSMDAMIEILERYDLIVSTLDIVAYTQLPTAQQKKLSALSRSGTQTTTDFQTPMESTLEDTEKLSA